MKISYALTGPLVASAFFNGLAHAALGIAGAIDNALEASLLQGLGTLLDPGSYVIKNVQTGDALTYTPVGNAIVPAGGAGTPVTISHYSDAVSWLRLQIGQKNKCLSAQWGGSYDHAGVMYECAVFGGGAVKAANTLEPTKQWWLAVPVGSDLNGAGTGSASFLAAAQQDSVKTREDAIKSGATKNAFANSRLVKRTHLRTPVVRHKKTTTTTTTTTEVVAAVKPKKEKTKSKSSSSKSSKAKAAAAKDTSASTSAVQLSAVAPAVAASGQKFHIIAVDHLIDMHTMALIGQSIDTAGNTQSTALATFDPTDTLQQWTITKA